MGGIEAALIPTGQRCSAARWLMPAKI